MKRYILSLGLLYTPKINRFKQKMVVLRRFWYEFFPRLSLRYFGAARVNFIVHCSEGWVRKFKRDLFKLRHGHDHGDHATLGLPRQWGEHSNFQLIKGFHV